MSSAKTVRIHNTSPGNLSFQLSQLRAPAHGSMKRGSMFTPVSIPQGGFYDVCAQLEVSYEVAKIIVRTSPDVRAFESRQRLVCLDYPPPPEVVPVAEPAVTPTVEEASVAAPVATPVAALAPEREHAPSHTTTPTAAEMVHEIDEVTRVLTNEVAKTVETLKSGLVELPPPAAPALTNATPAVVGTPSMDWSEDDLRTYAEKHEIDISRAKSKTAVLKTIRTGK